MKSKQSNDIKIQELKKRAKSLLKEAKEINQETEKISKVIWEDIAKANKKINASIEQIEKIWLDLDHLEEGTVNRLDELVLKQAEELAAEN